MPESEDARDLRPPTSTDATLVVRQTLGAEVETISRFPTGSMHYVYDALTSDGRRVVVRMARPDTQRILAGGVYWHDRLRAAGVPVPALLRADVNPANGFPYMLLERLPGRDLAEVYGELTPTQKRDIAHAVAVIQARVATLPRGGGFGFALSYDDAGLRDSWLDVVLADVERSRGRIMTAGVVSADLTGRVRQRVQAHAEYLRAVEPVPFLDDTTTKNVLIHDGALSGIVDTDHVCFGDPLFPVALTRLALLARSQPTDYVDFWTERLALDQQQVRAMDLYTGVFCLGFLSEFGQRFNQEAPRPVDVTYKRHLEELLTTLLDHCESAG